MVSPIFLEKDRIKISPAIKVIKAAEHSSVLHADAVLSEARAKAEQIAKEAESAYVSEKLRGYQDGLQTAKREMAAIIAATAIKSAQYFHAIEEKTANLVLDAVRKVINGTNQSELVIGLVKRALAVMKNQKQITLKVEPVHVDALSDHLSEILRGYPQIDTVEVRGDDRLSPGELIMESEIGIVDASVEVQLAAIKEAFSSCFRT